MSATAFVRSNGLNLPVAKNQNGQDVVPLKPVSDLYGLNWPSQRQKVLASPRFVRMLDVCYAEVDTGQGPRRQLCVNPKRMSLFLFALNLTKMRAAGNNRGVDLLVKRLKEMGEVLHLYCTEGVAIDETRRHPEAELAALQAVSAAAGPSPAIDKMLAATKAAWVAAGA